MMGGKFKSKLSKTPQSKNNEVEKVHREFLRLNRIIISKDSSSAIFIKFSKLENFDIK